MTTTEADRLHAAIDELASRKANWDSYSAEPANPAAIARLRAAVPMIVDAKFEPPPSVDMDNGGNPVLIWDYDEYEMKLTIYGDGGFEVEATGDTALRVSPTTAAVELPRLIALVKHLLETAT